MFNRAHCNNIFEGLSQKIKNVQKRELVCVLMFDEMAFKKKYFYNEKGGSIGGKEDYGVFGLLELQKHTH